MGYQLLPASHAESKTVDVSFQKMELQKLETTKAEAEERKARFTELQMQRKANKAPLTKQQRDEIIAQAPVKIQKDLQRLFENDRTLTRLQ